MLDGRGQVAFGLSRVQHIQNCSKQINVGPGTEPCGTTLKTDFQLEAFEDLIIFFLFWHSESLRTRE